jgi:NAD(P)-dependent dehydrogenase (short-subunit alcohol dehydrogenase family)
MDEDTVVSGGTKPRRWEGRTALVTGATSGIGLHTVERLAGEGATVLVHGRSPARVDAQVAELRGRGARVEGLVADLASMAEVAGLARAALALTGSLDVLINNAGIGFGRDRAQRELTADGFELRLAVNYLAPFVLTHELLARRAPLRAIVNVASIGQEPIDLGDLQLARSYDGVRAYRRSKLALIMLTFDLAEGYPAVASNALHPGTFLDTGMVRAAGIAPMGPASRGADTTVHALAAALERHVSGRYFDEERPAHADPQAYEPATRRALRERTLALLRPFHAAGAWEPEPQT